MPIERVAELFSREVNETLHTELEELVRAARKSLRRFLMRADMGISGANAIVAETGAVVVTENEGNIRAVSSMPKIHVVVAGIEKIVPTMPDAITVVRSAAVFGVGQDIGTYVSILAGPSRFENDDLAFLGGALGPEEMHVVLLKNGRTKAIQESYEESLYCINCGSCLNFCPIYAAIGEKYGYKYLGGRGAVFTAMHEYLEKAQEAGLSLCIDCRRCEEACAVGMKTPKMICAAARTAGRGKRLAHGQKDGLPRAGGQPPATLGQAGESIPVAGSRSRGRRHGQAPLPHGEPASGPAGAATGEGELSGGPAQAQAA